MNSRNWKHMAAALALGTAFLLPAGAAQALSVGDKAPTFSLPATVGKQAGMKDYAGKTLVLFFYTGAFTNAWTQEALAFQLDLPKFEAANAQVLGISVDFNGANQAWAEKLGLKYPLLSDSRRQMTRAYGVLNEDPAAAQDPKRAPGYFRAVATVMVVDREGTIRYIRDNSSERNTIPVDEILQLVEKMK